MKIDKEILLRAINKFGEENQLNRVVEESAELIKAIAKYRRSPNLQTLADIYDECADVLIMLEQMELIFGMQEVNWTPVINKTFIDSVFKRVSRELSSLINGLESDSLHVFGLCAFAAHATEGVLLMGEYFQAIDKIQERIDYKLERLKNKL